MPKHRVMPRGGSENTERVSDSEIDAAFAEMATDDEYLRESLSLAREFARSDWEAYKESSVNEEALTAASSDVPLSKTAAPRSGRRVVPETRD